MMPNHKRYFLQIKQIVNELDPLSLICDGAPTDEYEAEIQKILLLVNENLDMQTLAIRIAEIFSRSFDIPAQPSPRVFKEIAQRIMILRANT